MNYSEMKDMVDKAIARGRFSYVKWSHNSRLVRTAQGYGVQLHDTVIIEMLADNSYRLNSAGYQTATTKKYMNKFLPAGVRVFQKRHTWYVTIGEQTLPYVDGLTIQIKE